MSLLQATQACTILTLMSFCVLSIHDPRYLKSSTFLIFSLLTDLISVIGWLYVIISVFLAFKWRPTFPAAISTSNSRFCASSRVLRVSAMSSAKSKSLTLMGGCLLLLRFFNIKPGFSAFDVASLMT